MIAGAVVGRVSTPRVRMTGRRDAFSRLLVSSREQGRVSRLMVKRWKSDGTAETPRTTSTGTSTSTSTSASTSTAPTTTATAAAATASAGTAQTIPMPGSNWLAPFKVPLRRYTSLNQRRPYVTQFISAITIWMLGDLAAQYITSSTPPPAAAPASPPTAGRASEDEAQTGFAARYDPARTLRALLIGGAASIPSYRYFLWLGRSLNVFASLAANISVKVVFNQVFFTPLFGCYFFAAQAVLTAAMDGRLRADELRAAEVADRLARTVPKSWLDGWKVWPAVTAVSFALVPVDLRSLFAGAAAIGWQTYLGLLNQRAAHALTDDAARLRQTEGASQQAPETALA